MIVSRPNSATHASPAEYVLGVLSGGDVWRSFISYGESAPVSGDRAVIHILPCGLFDNAVYGQLAGMPRLPLSEIDGVPLLFGKPVVERRGNTLIVHADIVASTYFLTTRYEEWVRPEVRDQHGRFPGRESLAYRAGFLDRPIVDEYAALLRKWAREVGIDVPEPRRRFSVLLTHDVDSLGSPRGPVQVARCVASGLLGRRTPRRAVLDACAAVGLRRDAADNLDEVIRLDEQLTSRYPDRCRSVYFFMAGGSSPYDRTYRIRSAWMRDRLEQVARSGAEIGLHASYEAGENPERVQTERQTLQEASGLAIEKNRHHFLRWREPGHGQAIADAGIRWDATLCYADVAGFRLGVCRPVPLFDPIACKPLGIEEHPLTVMDCTLDRPDYMNLDEEAAFDHVKKLIDATRRHQGEFVGLWHNTVLAANDRSYHKRLYHRVLDYLGNVLECG